MALVEFEVQEGKIGVIYLNNPDKLNAMDEDMANAFSTVLTDLKKSSNNLRALLLTGRGSAFSAGGNLEMLKAKASKSKDQNEAEMLKFYEAFLNIRNLKIPLIAVLNGHAVGAGLCLACSCDIRLAVPEAKLGLTFTKLGLHPGMGATYFLPAILGQAQASTLLLTASLISAEEALRIGLINKVVKKPDIFAEALNYARSIAATGPQACKLLVNSLRNPAKTLSEALSNEAKMQSLSYANPEFIEGLNALIEKRKPDFD